jgi:hypothetical protein
MPVLCTRIHLYDAGLLFILRRSRDFGVIVIHQVIIRPEGTSTRGIIGLGLPTDREPALWLVSMCFASLPPRYLHAVLMFSLFMQLTSETRYRMDMLDVY